MFSATKSAELKLLNIAIRVSQWHGCPKTKTRQRWNLQNQDKTKTRQKESVLDPRQDKTKTRLVLVLSWFFQDRVCLVLVLSWFSKTETVLSWSCLGLGSKTDHYIISHSNLVTLKV